MIAQLQTYCREAISSRQNCSNVGLILVPEIRTRGEIYMLEMNPGVRRCAMLGLVSVVALSCAFRMCGVDTNSRGSKIVSKKNAVFWPWPAQC